MEAPHALNQLFALNLPKVRDRESEHRPLPNPCRKGAMSAAYRPLTSALICQLGENRIGIQVVENNGFLLAKSIYGPKQ